MPVSLVAVRIAGRAFALMVGGLDPDAVPLGEAPAMWEQFDRLERLAASAKILLRAGSTRRGSGSATGGFWWTGKADTFPA